MDVSGFGKLLLGLGALLLVVGGLLIFAGRLPGLGMFGRLPGDIYIQRGGWSIYIPLGTSLLISITLTLILAVFGRR